MATVVDYLAVGHVTLDRQEDGATLPGGTALYGAVQAARLGLRVALVTSGQSTEVAAALRPFRAGVDVLVLPAPATTTFANRGIGSARRQSVHAWAGPIDLSSASGQFERARIIHLGPVAQEIPIDSIPPIPAGTLLGVTPQGWLRAWGPDGAVRRVKLELPREFVARIDALILSESEQREATDVIAGVRASGGIVIVTLGERGCLVETASDRWHVPTDPVDVVDDTGAGDVFAATFFVARSEGRDPRAAAAYANVAAGLSIGGPGASHVPTLAAIDRHAARKDRGRQPATD